MRRMMRRRSTSSLRLARALPGADAAGLAGVAAAHAPPQAGQAVAQHGQLDLGLALEGVGVLAEDVEDHRGAVDGGATEQLLQVVLLGRGELVVEDDGVGVDGEAHLLQLLGLALADEVRRVGRSRRCTSAGHLVGAGGVDQERELVEARLGVVVGAGGR